MNILGNNSNKLNEVIFENRNKAYGAYAIRTSYDDSLKKSVLGVVGLAFMLFASVFIYNKSNVLSETKKNVLVDDPDNKDLVYVVDMEQPKPKTEQPQQTQLAAAAPSGGLPTQIIDNASPTASVNLDNSVNGQGTPDALGVSATSTVVTTNTVQSLVVGTQSLTTSEPVVVADDMPEFEGGANGLMRYVASNIVYPDIAKSIGKEGTVYVSFVVNELGYVENAKVMRGIGYGCDEEVLKVVDKMPRWKKAGKNGGHPVKVRFNIPVSFKLR